MQIEFFFLLWKGDRTVMEIWWKKFSHLKRHQIFWNRLIPKTEHWKKTLILRKQLLFVGLRKKNTGQKQLLANQMNY